MIPLNDSDQDTHRQQRNARILEHLRTRFGEGRNGELGGIEGVGLLSILLRLLPDEGGTADEGRVPESDLPEVRRRWRQLRRSRQQKGQSVSSGVDVPTQRIGSDAAVAAAPVAQLLGYTGLIEEIPQMRANFSEWLASVDADFIPSSSTLEELETLRVQTEYRKRVLTMMLTKTQSELDSLIVAIRAAATTPQD